MNVLIADDERLVLRGLQQIIDWSALGFSICGTADNGEDALVQILRRKPDLVLLDIRMPRMDGIEVIQNAVREGYSGEFIILSGVSDFRLAQTAMRYGVDYYLTKPIDEDELIRAVSSVRRKLQDYGRRQQLLDQYRDLARPDIIRDILLNRCDLNRIDFDALGLNAGVYQVAAYENYSYAPRSLTWSFPDLLHAAVPDGVSCLTLDEGRYHILLLQGDHAIRRFQRLLAHYQDIPQKGSPLEEIFLAVGRVVYRLGDVHLSCQDACRLIDQRFFCEEHQHILAYTEPEGEAPAFDPEPRRSASECADQFTGCIQSRNRELLAERLQELSGHLRVSGAEPDVIRHFIIDIYILVRQRIMLLYPDIDIPFPSNASVIDLLEHKCCLYELIAFLAEQFDLWMRSVSRSTGDDVIDEVVSYIRRNYRDPLKLETIAPLFGYNSSYLGKIFTRRVGMNFNAFLDQVRIEEAVKLLEQDSLKVYEVAEQVGYHSVDYFHKKFRKILGTSPAEYRRQRQGGD